MAPASGANAGYAAARGFHRTSREDGYSKYSPARTRRSSPSPSRISDDEPKTTDREPNDRRTGPYRVVVEGMGHRFRNAAAASPTSSG